MKTRKFRTIISLAGVALIAVVLAGAGRAFCAGDELGSERSPDEVLQRRRRGGLPLERRVFGRHTLFDITAPACHLPF